jgi:hypothetical protein
MPGGPLWYPQRCQWVEGKQRSLDANTSIPYPAQAGNADSDTLPEIADQGMEVAAQHLVAAMWACFLGCLRAGIQAKVRLPLHLKCSATWTGITTGG